MDRIRPTICCVTEVGAIQSVCILALQQRLSLPDLQNRKQFLTFTKHSEIYQTRNTVDFHITPATAGEQEIVLQQLKSIKSKLERSSCNCYDPSTLALCKEKSSLRFICQEMYLTRGFLKTNTTKTADQEMYSILICLLSV